MRANPHLLSGLTSIGSRFFVLAVFSTMYVRDHSRPAFHKALAMDPTDYDFRVFRITSQISQQVFPVKLDLDNPALHRGFDRLFELSLKREAAKVQGGISGFVKNIGAFDRGGSNVRQALYVASRAERAAGPRAAGPSMVRMR